MMRRPALRLNLLVLPLLGVSAFASAETAKRPDLGPPDRARVAEVVKPATDFSKAEPYEAMQAGAATSIEDPDRNAFSHFSANLPDEDVMNFRLGNALFRKIWVPAPSSTQASDGLGPFYNARSCDACHINDGRGHPPEGKADMTSIFLRLAREPVTDAEKAALKDHLRLNYPDPVYGGQLQDKAIAGVAPEGRMRISYQPQPFRFSDGTVIELRKTSYQAVDLRYGPLDPHISLSPRMAPAMIGLGLIEAIADEDILAKADPGDRDGDGVSGRPQWTRASNGEVQVGRFGWKGEQATVRDQSAHAFLGDIGISTPLLPQDHGDCSARQADCLALPGGTQARLGQGEAPDPVLQLVTFYSENLAVPARRKASFSETLDGKKLFYDAGCVSCHTPKYVTRKNWPAKPQRFQLIWPYSDFLLHDMGDGLADGQTVGEASQREWRTPPLWAIGLTRTVGGQEFYLHDGRARSLEEAILWHDGEALAARDAYANFDKRDRDLLIRFLESL